MNQTAAYVTEGISRKDRYPASLDPDYFQVDERTVDDLLLFITELSYEYNYFDNNNKPDGNWLIFFLSDPNLMLRIFKQYDFKRYSMEYDRGKQELAITVSEQELKNKLEKLIEGIYGFLDFQRNMFQFFQASINLNDSGEIDKFRNMVRMDEDYDVARRTFYALTVQLQNEFGIQYKGVNQKNFFADAADLPPSPFKFDKGNSLHTSIENAVNIFDGLFSKFEKLYNQLAAASIYFFQKQKHEKVSYKPHISLVLAFLELYQLLKGEVNQYTRKHLDLYYNRILGIASKNASADKVSVILALNKGVNEFLLEKGEKLLATIPGQTNKQLFSIKEDILLNQARITRLKTIYKSVHNNGEGEFQEPVKDYMIYAADNHVLQPEDHNKDNNAGNAWPLFGEDQAYIPAGERSMQEAETGLMVSSPLLYAEDGKRNISIRFHLAPRQFNAYFVKQAVQYEAITGIAKEVIITEMLRKAFVIDFTAIDKWVPVNEYFISCPLEDESDRFIEIRFTLQPDEPAMVNYDPEVHGTDHSINFPAVRLMLNNNSFQNPYAFLFEQVLVRLTINLHVKDSSRVVLQNNIGQLPSSNPFQLFGPQPSVGAYLEIKNTNIFNRYTRDFKIKLKWFDLPRNIDGFTDYYKGYNNNISNDSFKVGLSGLIDDNYLPRPEEQQVFPLFREERSIESKKFLADTTILDNIKLNKIRFDNEPLLQDEEKMGYDYKNGAVRIELLEPNDGFGHKLFPVIFPQILMHNAKWYHKDLPQANQPYIPMLRSVLVDYTLHHSEAVSGKKEPDKQRNIELWHIYPFGFLKLYPQDKREGLKLIPTIADRSNLYIGFEDILPGKVLTLLFQMEENNFQELEDEPNPISWCYLDHNEWKKIAPTDILEDNTINFKGTGIVKLLVPENISKENTLFSPDCYWLSVSCNGFIGSRIKGIFTQVATAVRDMGASDETVLSLDPFRITEFNRKMPAILNIVQPFPSYHGAAAETKEQFYTWVSEHLGHKQRLITSTDISQKILELFPQIHKVICFNSAAGKWICHGGEDLHVVVIPAIKSFNDDAIIEPKVDIYTLFRIRKYLYDHISPFLKIAVRNPDYEKIKVVCHVVFKEIHKDRSANMMRQVLNNDIRKFISPWLFSADAEINMNNGIYPSEILNYIKELPYIKSVSGFNVIHFYNYFNPETGKDESRLIDSLAMNAKGDKSSFIYGRTGSGRMLIFKGSRPGAILVSSEQHLISTAQAEKTAFKAENEIIKPPRTGIGRLAIGDEYLVMKPYPYSDYSGKNYVEEGEEDQIDFFYNSNL